jgi:hypothetical protein
MCEVYFALSNAAVLTFFPAFYNYYREHLFLLDDFLCTGVRFTYRAQSLPGHHLSRLLGPGRLIIYPLVRQIFCGLRPKQHLARWGTLWLGTMLLIPLESYRRHGAAEGIRILVDKVSDAGPVYVLGLALAYGLLQLVLGMAACLYTDVTARRRFIAIRAQQEEEHAHQD